MRDASLENLQINLVQKLFRTTEKSVLLKIADMLDNSVTVGFTTTGKPLNKVQYDQLLEEGEKDIQEGRTFSAEDMLSQLKAWQKKKELRGL